MLTRRAFVGGAVGMAAGAARAAPLPESARLPGIIVATSTGDIEYLSETGVFLRRVSTHRLAGPGWRLDSVSRDGTTAALFRVQRIGNWVGQYDLLALPLDGRPRRDPIPTTAWGAVWSGDGRSVFASRYVFAGVMGTSSYWRNIKIDLSTGRAENLWLSARWWTQDGHPETRHRVIDVTSDGRLYLTGGHDRGRGIEKNTLHLIPAAAPMDHEPVGLADYAEEGRFSPDGRRALVSRLVTVRPVVGPAYPEMVLEVRGVADRSVVEVGRWLVWDQHVGEGFQFRWRPDGRRVVVLAQSCTDDSAGWNQAGELVTLDPDGGNRRVVRSWVGAAPFRLLGWA
jgi:hypothetical protein